MNKYCIVAVCPNGSKKRPDLNYCCFPVKSGDRRRANQKFNRLIDPRICLKPISQLAFLVVKIFLQAAIRLSLTLQKRRIRPVRARSVLIIERGVMLNEEPSRAKHWDFSEQEEKEFKIRILHLEQNLSTEDIRKLWLWQHSQRSNLRTESLPFNRNAKKISGSCLLSHNTVQQRLI